MKMEHITINTKNLDASVAFYRDVLGLKVKSDFRTTVGMPIVFLWDGEDGVSVELIESADKAYCGSGISIGFHTDNVEVARAELEAKGLRPSPMISPNPAVKFFFIEDPNGVSIQLIG